MGCSAGCAGPSATFYLGWIAWDLHRRYRTADGEQRDEEHGVVEAEAIAELEERKSVE